MFLLCSQQTFPTFTSEKPLQPLSQKKMTSETFTFSNKKFLYFLSAYEIKNKHITYKGIIVTESIQNYNVCGWKWWGGGGGTIVN